MQDARIELLQRMPIFGGISKDTLAFLLGFCPVVKVAKDDYFFREDEPGDCLFVLEAGRVVAFKSWRGEEHILKVLGTGDCFGEMAVIDHGARMASIRALDDCSAIRISSADLYRIYAHDLKQFALIQMNMGREVCRRLREADKLLLEAAKKKRR